MAETRAKTPLWLWVNQMLGGTLEKFLREEHAAGTTLDQIVSELSAEDIPVSRESIRQWCLALGLTFERKGPR